VGFGLSSKILPVFPICHQLSPSLFDFRNNRFFYCVGLLAPRQTPTWRTRVSLFCLGHHS
jgi:hypothetical protein